MKFRPHQYAQALYEAIVDKKPEEQKVLAKRFIETLRKNRDASKLPVILKHFEWRYVIANDLHKVDLESASVLPAEIDAEIEKALGKKALISKKVNPSLLAGLRILLDDSVFIDSTARRHINNLFVK